MRLLTKAQRGESRNIQFENLIKNGFLKIEHKTVTIFYHPSDLLLKSFWGTAANHTDYYRYRSAEQMQGKINELKSVADRRETWKAEQKEKRSLAGAKITLSTLKKFVRDNSGNIYVKVLSSFDGMTDCVERVEDDFKLMAIKEDNGNNLGLSGVHLVGSSRDSFTAYNSTEFEGIEIYNSCGSCIVARKKETTQQAQTPAEVPAGKIQIVDYSEKAFAVIGEFSPYYDALIEMGGRYNKFLKCGRGIIFSKKRLEAVKEYLTAAKGKTQTQSPKTEVLQLPEPNKNGNTTEQKEETNVYITAKKASEKDCNWYGLKPDSYILTIHPFQWFPSDLLCTVVNGRYEDGHNIGVTISGNLGSASIGIVNAKAAAEMLINAGYEVKEIQPEDIIINESDILPTPENNTLKLESLKIIWHEGKHIEGATFEDTTFNTWEEVQRAFFILWQVNEKGSEGGYTKVKCEIKIQGHETEICRVDITDKVNNGDFNPSTQHIADYISELIGETDPELNTTMQLLLN